MINPLTKIRNSPPEVFHNRIVLVGIILAVWLFLKLLEIILPNKLVEAIPGPFPLAMLFVFIGITAFYMLYIYFSQKWKSRNKPQAAFASANKEEIPEIDLSNCPSVDVFIAARNERAVIIGTLQNMLQIDYPNYQVYVIDDRSSDGSSEEISKFIQQNNLQNKLYLIQRSQEDRPGKAAALNQALGLTQGDLVAVFDADASVDPNCLKLSLSYFEDSVVGAVQFQKKIRNADFNTLAFCQDLEYAYDTYLQVGRDSLNGFVELRGSGQIATRECLKQVGAWDERSLTEDLDISTKINSEGRRIRFAPNIVVWDEAVIRPLALFKQRRRWAEGSLRRYLQHFEKFISPKSKLSLVKRLDIVPFLSQFAVPIWIFLDILVEIFRFINGQPTYVSTLMMASTFMGFSMWLNIVIGVRRWRNYSAWDSLRHGTLAFSYGAAHWPPIVLWTARKVIFGRRPTEWVKTPRMQEVLGSKKDN